MSELKTFQFELVSPEEKLISAPATFAAIPGTEGVIGVLPGHSSVISSLKAGVVTFRGENDNEQAIFINGGFADISANNVTVLAEDAVAVSALNRAELEKQLETLENDLKIVEGAPDKSRIQTQIKTIQAKLAVVS